MERWTWRIKFKAHQHILLKSCKFGITSQSVDIFIYIFFFFGCLDYFNCLVFVINTHGGLQKHWREKHFQQPDKVKTSDCWLQIHTAFFSDIYLIFWMFSFGICFSQNILIYCYMLIISNCNFFCKDELHSHDERKQIYETATNMLKNL